MKDRKIIEKELKMKIYLDVCCFNRPFDDQSQIRIRLEAEAKLKIQEEIRSGNIQLVWSYILNYENTRNPFQEKKEQIMVWRKYAKLDVQENSETIRVAHALRTKGFHKLDSLHLACAISTGCDFFLTTDDSILKKTELLNEVRIDDPIGFIKEVFS